MVSNKVKGLFVVPFFKKYFSSITELHIVFPFFINTIQYNTLSRGSL